MTWVRGHFDLPATPDGTQMPATAQCVATVAMAVLAAGFIVYAVAEIARLPGFSPFRRLPTRQ